MLDLQKLLMAFGGLHLKFFRLGIILPDHTSIIDSHTGISENYSTRNVTDKLTEGGLDQRKTI